MDDLRQLAHEVLDTFAGVANAARLGLREKGLHMGALAMVNAATSETIARDMRTRNDERVTDLEALRLKPAIARLLIADEHDHRELLYITPGGTVKVPGLNLCSYMSPKGRLAPLEIGAGTYVPLPGGRRYFEVLEKTTFSPEELPDGWDSRPAVHYREKQGPQTIRSLRVELLDEPIAPETADALESWLSDDDGKNIVNGLVRDTLTAMQLRVAPILDKFQDDVFRLPLDSRIAVLGPPGTGKTTTLVKRLRQKLDFAFLDVETEQPMVEARDAAGLSHSESWLMFTPTELLRQYVKEAFGKVGVPVHDERIRTWDDFRQQIGRRELGLLRTAGRSGFVTKDDDGMLQAETLRNQIGWFEAFEAYQKADFVQGLQAEAERLQAARNPDAALLGQQALAAIARSGDRPLQLLGELLGLDDRLRKLIDTQRAQTRIALQAPLNLFANSNVEFLAALARFVEKLQRETPEEIEDDDTDDGEDGADERQPTLRGRKLIVDIFIKAMRARAIGQAGGRAPKATSQAGCLLAWLESRDLTLPDLKDIGQAVLVQRAAQRISQAPSDYLSKIALRYRRFRRIKRADGEWYGEARVAALDAHPAEIDMILLSLLRNGRAMERDAFLSGRLGDRIPTMLDSIGRLRRNQILVDEATDFSPVQLACMRELASLATDSFFVSGDFNQRLTKWGSRSEAELLWVSPTMQIVQIDVTYRQSRELADFAGALAQIQGYEVKERARPDLENPGIAPVLGLSLSTVAQQASWLATRIREIEGYTDGVMPTIAVLVSTEDDLAPLETALSAELQSISLRAQACPKGLVKGQEGDVRIFSVEHIKGLEFEAVFFVDIDRLAELKADMFHRYVYVGATRAATFLGVTCRGPALPAALAAVEGRLGEAW